jgi:hypothetical protein
MKIQKTCLSLFAMGCAVSSSSIFAATCNNTQGSIAAPPATPAAIAGNSCGHNSNYNGSTFCGGVSFSNTGTDVYQVVMGNAQALTFSVTSAAFTPDIALLATTCADNATCTVENSSGGASATANVPNGSSGTFFIIVTDSTGAGAQCGAYNLSFTGKLPVKLQDFSVQ